jgi:hypothetical protein
MPSVPRVSFLLWSCVLMLGVLAVGQEKSATQTGAVAATTQKTPTPAETPKVETQAEDAKPEAQAPATKPEDKAANEGDAQRKPESDIVPEKAKKPLGPPTTKTMAAPKDIVAADALLAPPPAPKGKVSLIGGTVKNIDQIRNRLEVSIFGGSRMRMFFDERSHFFRDGVETTQLAVKKGDRIYVDSQLDQGKIFARNVHVQSERPIGAASGQVLAYNPRNGELTLSEPISAKPLMFKVTRDTAFRRGDQPGSAADLRNNAIVRVTFLPSPGKRSEVKEVELVAVPGTKFTFYGRLTHLDLRSGILGVENKSDSRLYEVRFRPSPQTVTDDLVIGAEVSIVAIFTGKDYAAESLQVTRTAQGQSKDEVQ